MPSGMCEMSSKLCNYDNFWVLNANSMTDTRLIRFPRSLGGYTGMKLSQYTLHLIQRYMTLSNIPYYA